MNNRGKTLAFGIMAVIVCLILASPAGSITLPDPLTNAVLYGNAYSYSLPILAYEYNLQFGGGVGPGNPFYVASTPGQIKDDIVISHHKRQRNE